MDNELPKDKAGGLDHGFVCNALHRFFVQQHGWYVNAFEPEGEPWNTAAVKETLKEKIPSHVQKKVEENAQIRELHNELPKDKDGGLDHALIGVRSHFTSGDQKEGGKAAKW